MGKKYETTASVRLSCEVLDIVRDVKDKIGFPMGRFIEDAIVEKIDRLPKSDKEKIGLKELKKSLK